MKRVSVIGTSGSGKTTVGRAVAARLGLPFCEMDTLFHRPNWGVPPAEEFIADVRGVVATVTWVVDGNYVGRGAREAIWERADTVVWLDYARATVMRQVVWRSLMRAASRRELWAGNRERFRDLLDPGHPIRWSWSGHASRRLRDEAMLRDERWAHLRVVRLPSRAETRRWLRGCRKESRNPGEHGWRRRWPAPPRC